MVGFESRRRFKLPRVEKEKFMSLLIRLGLIIIESKAFSPLKATTTSKNSWTQSAAYLGSEVIFLQTCTRCGKDFPCSDCKYDELCTTKNLPFSCVCPQCLRDRKHFEEYIRKILTCQIYTAIVVNNSFYPIYMLLH